MLLLEERLTPGRARRDAMGAAGEDRADVEEGIEGAADVGNANARDRPQPGRDEVAADLKGSVHRGHAFLGAVQRRKRRMLADAAGIARLLALEIADRLGERLRADRPADPPAGHRVGLADTGDDDGAVGEAGAEGGERDSLPAVEDELVVDLVGDDREIGSDGHVGEIPQLLRRIDHPGGIARRAEEEHPRGRGKRGAEGLRTELEIILEARREDHRPRSGELDELRIAHPVGGRDDHLVPLVEERREDVVERVLGAVGDDNLCRRHRQAGAAGVVGGHRFAEIGDTGRRRVFRPPGVDRRLSGSADVVGGGKVGLTDRQIDDIDPRRGHGLGPGRHGKRGGGFEGVHPCGDGEGGATRGGHGRGVGHAVGRVPGRSR